MYEALIFLYIILGISHMILFFKVWGMTNNIRKIKEHLMLESCDSDREVNKQFIKILFDILILLILLIIIVFVILVIVIAKP